MLKMILVQQAHKLRTRGFIREQGCEFTGAIHASFTQLTVKPVHQSQRALMFFGGRIIGKLRTIGGFIDSLHFQVILSEPVLPIVLERVPTLQRAVYFYWCMADSLGCVATVGPTGTTRNKYDQEFAIDRAKYRPRIQFVRL